MSCVRYFYDRSTQRPARPFIYDDDNSSWNSMMNNYVARRDNANPFRTRPVEIAQTCPMVQQPCQLNSQLYWDVADYDTDHVVDLNRHIPWILEVWKEQNLDPDNLAAPLCVAIVTRAKQNVASRNANATKTPVMKGDIQTAVMNLKSSIEQIQNNIMTGYQNSPLAFFYDPFEYTKTSSINNYIDLLIRYEVAAQKPKELGEKLAHIKDHYIPSVRTLPTMPLSYFDAEASKPEYTITDPNIYATARELLLSLRNDIKRTGSDEQKIAFARGVRFVVLPILQFIDRSKMPLATNVVSDVLAYTVRPDNQWILMPHDSCGTRKAQARINQILISKQ